MYQNPLPKEPHPTLPLDPSLLTHNALKRVFDILFSLSALLALSPLFCLLGLLVKLTSHGPIFYSSLRLGRGGTLFKFWKFRSMYRDADERLEGLLQSNRSLRQEWKKYFKLKNDPRLTPLGKFIRRTSLDELPQFWNVLVGDLSVVGPRPYLPRELDTICGIVGRDVETLFSVRPGLTGLWQTSGRNFLTFKQRVELDVQYVHKRSFRYDLQLIAKTIPALFFPNGAF